MPAAHFRFQTRGINRVREFRQPKNLSDSQAWVTAVRRSIPEVPNTRTTDWYVFLFDASMTHILIELRNTIGEKCHIAINRQGALFDQVRLPAINGAVEAVAPSDPFKAKG